MNLKCVSGYKRALGLSHALLASGHIHSIRQRTHEGTLTIVCNLPAKHIHYYSNCRFFSPSSNLVLRPFPVGGIILGGGEKQLEHFRGSSEVV